MQPKLIAFTGPMGCGKSTAAEVLERVGFRRVKFASVLKAMFHTLLDGAGLSHDEVRRCIEGDLKEVPHPALCGRTPRYAMQTLGTEWGRARVGPDLWTGLWQARAKRLLEQGVSVVADDCRFPDEAAAVRALGGKVVRITGRGEAGSGHASEAFDFEPDMEIGNVGDERVFRTAVHYVFGLSDLY